MKVAGNLSAITSKGSVPVHVSRNVVDAKRRHYISMKYVQCVAFFANKVRR